MIIFARMQRHYHGVPDPAQRRKWTGIGLDISDLVIDAAAPRFWARIQSRSCGPEINGVSRLTDFEPPIESATMRLFFKAGNLSGSFCVIDEKMRGASDALALSSSIQDAANPDLM
jgi:hypothetical protein